MNAFIHRLQIQIQGPTIKFLTEPPFFFIEQGGQLINDTTGMPVGKAFTESMPIEKLKNGPYEVNQH